MEINSQNIEELIEITKIDVEKHFVLDDGRIIFNGQIFKDKSHLERYFKASKQVLTFTNKVRRLFGLKPI